MRSIAIKKGFKLNEYGLFEKKNERYVVGRDENEIYAKLGLTFIEPELRENRGEIEAASKNKLPKLVKYNEIKGDLHVHSNWSDGAESVETMAQYAKKMGYEYIGITDHSQSLKIARGLSEEKLTKKINEIQEINKKITDIKVLCGAECDIKSDGALDYSDKMLKKLDFVCIGIHSNLKMTFEKATKRIIKGMENEHADYLAHPTCRLIGYREPLNLDIEKILDVARDTNTFLEINSFPDRLDLNDIHVKLAKEKDVKIVIGTDAHNINHLPFMQFGIATARRGWLEKKDILNTHSLKEVEKIFGM